jgi:hypothetical protein
VALGVLNKGEARSGREEEVKRKRKDEQRTKSCRGRKAADVFRGPGRTVWQVARSESWESRPHRVTGTDDTRS